MKRILSADFFELRKSKTVFILPAVAVLLGFLMPMLYYGIVVLFRQLGKVESLADSSFLAVTALMEVLDGRTVFVSGLPLSQGFGLVMVAMIGFRAVRAFGTGIYRNKIIANVPRSAIYLSQSLICLILSLVSAAIYILVMALTTRLTFGRIELSSHEILVITLLSLGIYLVYTAIPVYAAFLTRSVPLTILIAILTPVLGQMIVSFAAAALMSAPEAVTNWISILPSVQSMYLQSPNIPDRLIWISMISDVVIAAALTVAGVLQFRRADLK